MTVDKNRFVEVSNKPRHSDSHTIVDWHDNHYAYHRGYNNTSNDIVHFNIIGEKVDQFNIRISHVGSTPGGQDLEFIDIFQGPHVIIDVLIHEHIVKHVNGDKVLELFKDFYHEYFQFNMFYVGEDEICTYQFRFKSIQTAMAFKIEYGEIFSRFEVI